MRLRSGLSALTHRDYGLYFSGQLVSLIGSWMQVVGQSWLVIQLTKSPFKLGIITALQFLPMLFFSLLAGALVDRLPKRKTIVATQTLLMLLAFTLSALVYTGRVQFWHVALLAFLLGMANTVDVPSRQAFTISMVGKEDLGNAIALNSAVFNGARLVGPMAAGLLVAKFGVATAFFLNGVSFVAVIGALLLIKTEGLPRPWSGTNRSIVAEIKEGLTYVFANRLILFVLALLMMISLFVINYEVLVTTLTTNVLKLNADHYGYLMSALGGGALLGAVLLAFSNRSGPQVNTIVVCAIGISIATLAMGTVRQFWPALVGLFVIGMLHITFTANTNTAIQISIPDELRGRVMSVYQLVFAGVTPLGAFVTGTVAEARGGSVGYLFDGALGLISVLLLLLWWRSTRKSKNSLPRPT
jgi:MFS family permease